MNGFILVNDAKLQRPKFGPSSLAHGSNSFRNASLRRRTDIVILSQENRGQIAVWAARGVAGSGKLLILALGQSSGGGL